MLGIFAFWFLLTVYSLCILAGLVKNTDDEIDEANANNELFRQGRIND